MTPDEFPEYYEPKNVHKIFGISKDIHQRLDNGLGIANSSVFSFKVTQGLEQLDENRLNAEFLRIRRELRDHQKIYQKCSEKLSGMSKKDTASLSMFRNDTDMRISLLKKQSVFIVYQIARMYNFQKVDLHGLTLQEAQEAIITVLDQIMRQITSNNLRKFNVEVITGKGLHSQGEAVLHPRIKQFLAEQGYLVKSSKDEGKLDVTIKA